MTRIEALGEVVVLRLANHRHGISPDHAGNRSPAIHLSSDWQTPVGAAAAGSAIA